MPRRPGRQSHQNEFKFKHNKGSKTTKKILAIPVTGLCLRCYHIVQWRKDYRKYKPLTTVRRCAICKEPRITQSYHIYCLECVPGKCAKCGKDRERELIGRDEIEMQYNKRVKEIESSLTGVRESERRKILREIKDEIKRENAYKGNLLGEEDGEGDENGVQTGRYGGDFDGDLEGEELGEFDGDDLESYDEFDGEDGELMEEELKTLHKLKEMNLRKGAGKAQSTDANDEALEEESDEEEYIKAPVAMHQEDTFKSNASNNYFTQPRHHQQQDSDSESIDSDDSFGEVFSILKKK